MDAVIDNVKYTLRIEADAAGVNQVVITAVNFINLRDYQGILTVVPAGTLTQEKIFECAADALKDDRPEAVSRTIVIDTPRDAIDVTVNVTSYVGNFTLRARLILSSAHSDIASNNATVNKFACLMSQYDQRIRALENRAGVKIVNDATAVKEYSPILYEQRITALEKNVAAQNDKHKNHMDVVNKRFEEFSRDLNEWIKRLEKFSEDLDERTKRLDRHEALIKRLQTVTAAIEGERNLPKVSVPTTTATTKKT